MANASDVSAVPSGSAGEPTPTDAASRLAAIHASPSVRVALFNVRETLTCRHGCRPTDACVDRDADLAELVSAVAAAATAQAVEALNARAARCREEDIAETYRLAADCVRALAGGAPPETQGVSDAD